MSPPYLQFLLAQPEVTLALAGMMSMTVLKSMVLKLPSSNIFFFIAGFSSFLPMGWAVNLRIKIPARSRHRQGWASKLEPGMPTGAAGEPEVHLCSVS